jgi:hypothetical protein
MSTCCLNLHVASAAWVLLVGVMLCRTSRSAAIPQELSVHTETRLFHRSAIQAIASAATFLLTAGVCYADPFFFSTGNPDGLMASASRPASPGKFEIESADDFNLISATTLTSATFVGLLTGGATVGEIRVEIYRVFPKDSDVGRTSGPPTFSTPQVPTRVNSPSDVEFVDRDTADAGLTFTTSVLSNTFSTLNSIQPGGIHPLPNVFTGGDGPVTGEEVQFNITFTVPIDLQADHYFFIPQVEVTDPSGNFFWLSAPRPIVPPGTPFPLGSTDLQSWTRDEFLDPDWLRIGTDITHQGPFNATFSLNGSSVPEPGTLLLLIGAGMSALWWGRKRNS